MSVFFIILVASATPTLSHTQSRIGGGFTAPANSVPSFVAIRIEWTRGTRLCGGLLGPTADQIITAAGCVWDPFEGKANNVQLAFGQTNNYQNVPWDDIYRLRRYNSASNTSDFDLAIILLINPVPTSVSVATANPSTNGTLGIFVGLDVTVCGYGNIDNFRNKPTTLQCTTLRVVPPAECGNIVLGANASAIASWICTRNPTIDRNVCGGDIGAPVYLNSGGSLIPVGIVSFYPDSRQNARCQDGHYAAHTRLGIYTTFWQNVLAAAALPATSNFAAINE